MESKNRRATDITKEKEQNMVHITDLPSHIMSEIIVRLPIKTIILCASVCKAWCSIISDSTFTKLHLARAPKHASPCFVVRPLGVGRANRPLGYLGLRLHSRFLTILPDPTMRVVATCNGLLCLVNIESLYICNPIIGEYVTLPIPTTEDVSSTVFYSFGFSPKTNEYKVVGIFKRQSKWEGEIYTLGTNAWRSIGDIEFPLHTLSSIVYLNGAFHWFAEGVHDLCSFDIANERLGSFPSPPLHGEEIAIENLGVMESCLFLTEGCNNISRNVWEFHNIWVMNDYGVKESWTKKFVIKNRVPCLNNNQFFSGLLVPIKVLKKGNLLMLYANSILVTYNPRMGSAEKLEVPGEFPAIGSHYVTLVYYVPSFLSPKDAGMGE